MRFFSISLPLFQFKWFLLKITWSSSVCISPAWISMRLQARVCGFCWTKQNIPPLRWKPLFLCLSLSLCLSLWWRRQMFSLSLWISFHRFLPSLFLGLANRTQPVPRDTQDSRVIVSLAPGSNMSASLIDLLNIKRKEFNRWTGIRSVLSLSFSILCLISS